MFVRYFTLTLILITFCLLLLGGYVHNTGSSLACPDWPLCYGQVLPPMEGGILIEHSHRLLASLVGFLTIILALLLKMKFSHLPHLKKWGYIALGMVILQGLLGGLTVIYQLPTFVSTSHLSLSMIYISTLVYIHHLISMDVMAKKIFHHQNIQTNSLKLSIGEKLHLKWVLPFILIVFVLVYLQIVLGAFIRHSGAGAACGLGVEYALQCFEINEQTSLTGQKVFWPQDLASQWHMLHRYYALFITFLITVLSFSLLHKLRKNKKNLLQVIHQNYYHFLLFISLTPFIVVLMQVTLGVLTIANQIGEVSTTLHLGGGALLLLLLWKLCLSFLHLDKFFFSTHNSYEKISVFFKDLLELTKPKLSGLVLLTVMAGMLLSPTPLHPLKVALILIFIGMIVGGACALNCYLEIDIDKKMNRTQNRALPSGRLNPKVALIFSLVLIGVALPLLYLITNLMTFILALIATVFYIWFYTPMKQKSPVALFVGAIPGALPPVMGWTSITGEINLMAAMLFFILFFWQLCHFLAISIYYMHDYKSADIQVFSHVKGIPYTKMSIALYAVMLFIVSVAPFSLERSSFSQLNLLLASFAWVGAVMFLFFAFYGMIIGDNLDKNKRWARQYFFASIVYLPFLFGIMVFF